MWARRLIIGSSLALASLAIVPSVAGADPASCTPSNTYNVPTTCAVVPAVSSTSDGPTTAAAVTTPTTTPAVHTTAATTSSLPFTGADVEELAVVGVGAVLAGGLLLRRRRRSEA
jgi:LPXTG-motif cell wall-anchored protein